MDSDRERLSRDQKLLFLQHSSRQTSRGVAISHATRWVKNQKQIEQTKSAHCQALYPRSLVGWYRPDTTTSLKSDIVKEMTTLADTQRASQNEKKPPINIKSGRRRRVDNNDTQRSMRKFQFQWRIAAKDISHRIDPPNDTRQVDYILRQAVIWTENSFFVLWQSQMQDFPYIFDIDRRAEMLRDAFLLVSDLLEAGETRLAFSSLNEILDTIPRYFVNSHPGLFLCLLEVALGVSMPRAPEILHKKVQEHMAEISRVLNGSTHPITVLLSHQFGNRQNVFHIKEVLLSCLTDVLAKLFGQDGYQTRFHQFTKAQNYARMGQIEQAQLVLTRLIKACSDQFGSDNGLVGLSMFELNRISLQWSLSQASAYRIAPQDDSHILSTIEKSFDRYNLSLALQTRESLAKAALPIPSWRLDLARYLFYKRRYAFAMHLLCSGSFDELSFYNPQVRNSADIWLADRIVDMTRQALQI